MFQFAGLPPVPYVFRYGYRRITSGEFPHSEILGSQDGQLLLRAYRSRPRPSSALGAKASTVCPCSLDQKEHACCRYGVFKVHADRPGGRSLKTQQRDVHLEVDVVLGEPAARTAEAIDETGAYRSKSSGFPRKEVIDRKSTRLNSSHV